jgi:predicted unusual protein kinase regulating ubiquinone biosynthesis (AarF/ABC1/UbiB family)
VGEILRGVLNLVRVHRIRVNANYATLVVNVLCIEGLARKLVPYYNILDGGKPLLESYRRLLVENPGSRWRKLLFKMVVPFAHVQKHVNDRRFFKNHDRKLAGLGKKGRLRKAAGVVAKVGAVSLGVYFARPQLLRSVAEGFTPVAARALGMIGGLFKAKGRAPPAKARLGKGWGKH